MLCREDASQDFASHDSPENLSPRDLFHEFLHRQNPENAVIV